MFFHWLSHRTQLCIWMIVNVILFRGACDELTQSRELTYLQGLYSNGGFSGCGMKIKCYETNNATSDVLLSNSTEGLYECCYDCIGSNSCQDGFRCHTGWQCCSGLRSQMFADESNLFDDFDEYKSCQSTLFYPEHHLLTTTHMEDVEYSMVSKCPDWYYDDDTINKCSDESLELPIHESIPYIALRNYFTVFRNIYCVRCHNISEDFITPFSVSLNPQLEQPAYQFSFISQFETIREISNLDVSLLLNISGNNRNIVVTALPKYLKYKIKLFPRPCSKGRLVLRYIENTQAKPSQLQMDACQMFNFPITVTDSITRKRQAFKNLACAFIKNPKFKTNTFPLYESGPLPSCTLEDNQGPRLIVNIHPEKKDEPVNKRHARVTTPYDIDKAYPSTDRYQPCRNGFFMDPFQKKCIRMLCPFRQYIFEGRCEPLYLETIRHSYFTMIKISPLVQLTKLEWDKITAIFDIITRVTDTNLCKYEIAIKKTSNKIEYAIVNVWLTPKGDTSRYNDVISRIQHVYDDELYHERDKAHRLDDLVLSEADHVYTDPSATQRQILDKNDEIDLKIIMKEDKYCGNILPITSFAYCYRVELKQNTYSVIKDGYNKTFKIALKPSNRIVYNDHYEILANGNIRICIKDFLRKTGPIAKINTMKTKKEFIGTIHSDGEMIDLYFCIGLGSLTALFCGVICACRFSDKFCPVQNVDSSCPD